MTEHGLVMEVHERPLPANDPAHYYAHFKRAEIQKGALLIGAYGDGQTPEQAIAAYSNRISLQTLIVDASSKERRVLDVPRLVPAQVPPASLPARTIDRPTWQAEVQQMRQVGDNLT